MSEQKSEAAAQAAQSQPAHQNGEVPWWRNDPWLGGHLAAENRYKNRHLLTQYEGKHVAWFPDCSGIRDADEDPIALFERIKASGDDPYWYTYDYIPDLPQI